MTMETILRSLDDESESEGESRIHFVLRSLAGQERRDSLIIVAHAITLAAAATLADANTGDDTLDCAPSEKIDVLEGEIDRIRLGVRFPPGSVVTLNLIDTGPPMAYELLPDVVPPLSYGELYSNGPVFESVI
ncbi:Tat pathway signal sequence domain protein [Cooperia oncophora]